MRRLLPILLLLICGSAVWAQPARLLNEFLSDSTLKWASVGVDLRAVDGGEQIVEHNSHYALIPASVTKLISTAYALDICGADHTLKTKVHLDDGRLIINAVGDPTLDSKYFPEYNFLKSVVESLQPMGVKSIDTVIINSQILSEGRYNGTWLSEDVANYYGANWLPFNWNDNSCKITIGSNFTKSYFISEEPSAGICNYNCLVNVERGALPDVWIYGGANGYREIRGVMDTNMKSYSVNGSMGFPELYFNRELKRIMQRHSAAEKREDYNNVPVFEYVSPRFSEIVKVANRRSVNLYVEALANVAANMVDGPGTYCDKIERWLEGIADDYKGVVLKDACGLAPLNRVPVSVFADLLLWGRERWDSAFYNSLAISGDTGTLKNFTRSYPHLHGKIVAKSGSMSGVRALSGYIKAKSGKEYAFAIIVNGFTCSGSAVMNSIASFLSKLYVEL